MVYKRAIMALLVQYVHIFLFLLWGVVLCWSTAGAAAEPPAALLAANRLDQVCGPEGQQIPVGVLLFALPGEGFSVKAAQAPAGCDPAQPVLLPEAVMESWELPVRPGATAQVLWQDGSRRPARLLGAVQQGSGLYLAAALDQAPSDLGAVALLLSPTPAGPAPVVDPGAISGTLRRRVGRQSFAVPGRFIGEGGCLTAIFKRRAEGLQMAIFGEDGGLRLYQTVPWRRGPALRLRPAAVFPVPDLSGAGRDGLLVAAQADSGATSYLLVEFAGKTFRASFQEAAR